AWLRRAERVAALHQFGGRPGDDAPRSPSSERRGGGVVLRRASAGSGEQVVGCVGEVHPETRERFGIDRPCFAFEIDLERLPKLEPARFQPIRRFPAVVRDVSFFVDENLPADRVRDLALGMQVANLESVRVLEDYREQGRVPPGKKGMLWQMTYRALERTLTDEEVDGAHERLVAGLLAGIDAERR
ncbi:MAG: hypothetical protein V2A73_05245, partial [Pseudomonadota bacterium]